MFTFISGSRPRSVSKYGGDGHPDRAHHCRFSFARSCTNVDQKGFDDLANASQDEEGILRSRSTLQALIAHEIEKEGIPSNRIVLGGFSQGGAMALVTGLTSTHRLAGIVGMSCYLPIAGRVPELIAAAQPSPSKEVPVQMYHGADDPLVKTAWGVRSKELISELGWKVEMKTYPGLQHSAAEEEIEDLEKWLDGKIGSPGATGGVGASKA